MDHEGYQRWLKESKGAWYTGLGMLVSGAEGGTGYEGTTTAKAARDWEKMFTEVTKKMLH